MKMNNRHFFVILLIAASIAAAACNRGDTVKNSVNTGGSGNNIASNESATGSGGHVAVITGADVASVKMRATRFR